MRPRTTMWCCGVVPLLVVSSGCAALHRKAPRDITVVGVADVVIPPDFVTVETSVVTLEQDVEKAQAENDKKVKAVLAFVRRLGVAPRDIRTQYTSLSPKERHEQDKPPVFLGYEASKSISVVLRDMTKYDELLSGVLKVGVNRIAGISFGSSQAIEMRRKARLLAIQAAREKAEYLAAALGQRLGRPLWISESEAQAQNFVRRVSGDFEPEIGNAAFFFPSVAEADTQEGTLAPGSRTHRAQVAVHFALR